MIEKEGNINYNEDCYFTIGCWKLSISNSKYFFNGEIAYIEILDYALTP